MKRVFKNPTVMFVLGALIFSSISVYAAGRYYASDITYKETTLDKALDTLYTTQNTTVNNLNSQITNLQSQVDSLTAQTQNSDKKICTLKSGNALTIGSKYECDPGDGTKRNFFVLVVGNNQVKLIMEKNITQGSNAKTMTWMNAMKYFRTGAGSSTKASWVNVIDVDLPMAQDIANAVGNTGWNMEDNNYDGWFYFDKNGSSYGQTQVANSSNLSNFRWLYNYTRECSASGCDSATSLGSTEAYGYWTRDIVAQQKDSAGRAWAVGRGGNLSRYSVSDGTLSGVRPVITVLKSNL